LEHQQKRFVLNVKLLNVKGLFGLVVKTRGISRDRDDE